jgi:hypothetical protein
VRPAPVPLLSAKASSYVPARASSYVLAVATALAGWLVAAPGCPVAAQAPQPASPSKLAAVQVGSRVDISVDGAFFTSYVTRTDEKYPFFFPVNAPGSGASVTSMRNGEYPHHSSLFFGCDRVNGGNYWQEGLEKGQIVSRGPRLVTADGAEIVLVDACDWKRPDAPQPLSDERRFVITAPAKDVRQIDADITLTALAAVTIEKTNHSLFSVRLDQDLSVRHGGRMINASGAAGEKATFGQASPWMAAFATRGSATEGLALFQHPSNPWYPAPWFTRDYGFLSPTPMYWPADDVATRLAKGDTLRLRYRVVVFTGDPGTIDLAGRFKAYAQK